MTQRNSLIGSAITISDYNTNPTVATDDTQTVMLIDDEPEEYDEETHPTMKLPPGFKFKFNSLTLKVVNTHWLF